MSIYVLVVYFVYFFFGKCDNITCFEQWNLNEQET